MCLFPLGVLWPAVLTLVQVEVRPGRCTPVGRVTKLVDVEPVQTLWEVRPLASDGYGVTLGHMGDVSKHGQESNLQGEGKSGTYRG